MVCNILQLWSKYHNKGQYGTNPGIFSKLKTFKTVADCQVSSSQWVSKSVNIFYSMYFSLNRPSWPIQALLFLLIIMVWVYSKHICHKICVDSVKPLNRPSQIHDPPIKSELSWHPNISMWGVYPEAMLADCAHILIWVSELEIEPLTA